MNFDPKSESELKSEMNMLPGTYDFEVVDALEKKSKTSGNDMIELVLKVYNTDGTSRQVKDWLVASNHPLCLMKVRHFCYSVGMGEAYEAGTFSAVDCNRTAGKVQITVESSEEYGDQNKVKDYVVPKPEREERKKPEGVAASKTRAAYDDQTDRPEGVPEDEDLPF